MDDDTLPIVEPNALVDIFVTHIALIEQSACCTRFYLATMRGSGDDAVLEVQARVVIPTHLIDGMAALSTRHVDAVSRNQDNRLAS